MNQHQNDLVINAKELGLADLDFPECAASLNRHIDKVATTLVASINLDVRWCVIIYSQAHIFLDTCLSKLVGSTADSKRLIILTTDNYVTRELTCYELFRTTSVVNISDHDPKSVSAALDRYCLNNQLRIEVQVFSGDTEDPSASMICSYIFPENTL
jgi:hypothetical protein